MAKKHKGARRKMTLPVAVLAPIGANAYHSAKHIQAGEYHDAAMVWTGMDKNGNIVWGRLMQTYLPIAAGIVIHKFLGPSINKQLAAAKVPYLRV